MRLWQGNVEWKSGAVLLLFLVLSLATLHSGCAGVASSGNPSGPTVSITSPAAGATVSASTTVSANASSDAVGVQFKLDGANLGSEKTSAPFSFSWDTSTTANGAHTLTAVARNSAGRTATSGAVSVTVQNSSSGGPTISITSPTSSATLSGTSTLTAVASSPIGIAGVQFLLDGGNLGAEVTAAPYSYAWDTTAASDGAHTLAARARDTSGTTATSNSVNITVSNGGGGSDFQTRCNAPGVIRCFGFDSPSEIAGDVGNGHGTLPAFGTTNVRPDIDTTVHASGAGSLRFTNPAHSPADIDGSFFTNFADDFSNQIGEGQDVYVQWRQRYDSNFIRQYLTNPPGGTGGWKMLDLDEGDRAPCSPTNTPSCATTCVPLEMVVTTDYRYMGPYFYHNCGFFTGLEWNDGTQIRLQDQGPPFCYYPGQPPSTGCFQYVANEWLAFQLHVHVGTWNTNSSRIELWAARQGQQSIKISDSINGFPSGFLIHNDNPTQAKFGKVWLLIYHTNKDASEVYPTAYTWVDELVISRQKIADPK